MSQAETARRLGISAPTVCFPARHLGVERNHDFAKRYDWAAIRAHYEDGHSAAECRQKFGCGVDAWAEAVKRGTIVPRPRLEPLEEILAVGRPRSRRHVKARLLGAGLKPGVCECCGVSEWRDSPLCLELHHINGDGLDNRLENLQLLCPNCHSQTDTWGGRNKARLRSSNDEGRPPRSD